MNLTRCGCARLAHAVSSMHDGRFARISLGFREVQSNCVRVQVFDQLVVVWRYWRLKMYGGDKCGCEEGRVAFVLRDGTPVVPMAWLGPKVPG